MHETLGELVQLLLDARFSAFTNVTITALHRG